METKVIQVRLPEGIIKKIDEIVESGEEYTSRQDFIKDKIRDIFKETTFDRVNACLKENLDTIKDKLPKGWELYTWMCPIQYKKIVEIKGQKYEGYLRSRWGNPFSIEVFKLDKNSKWIGEETFWTHKFVDKESDNPPLNSMKIIDDCFENLKEDGK